MIKVFDDWIFDRVFQPAVNRFPDVSPVECGRFFLMGAMFTAFFGIASNASFMNVALWLVGIGASSYMYFAAGRMKSSRARNPMRIAPMSCLMRVFFVFIVLYNAFSCAVINLSTGFMVSLVFNIAMMLFLYVGACDSPPPSKEVRSVKPSQLAYANL